MTLDLTKLLFHSGYPAFHNNTEYSGSFIISGTTTAGYSERVFFVPIQQPTDLVDIIFNGPTDTQFGSDPRPSSGWFKSGPVWVLGDDMPNGYDDYPMPFFLNATIEDNNIRITAHTVQQFTATLSLAPTTVYYKIIDYSVLG